MARAKAGLVGNRTLPDGRGLGWVPEPPDHRDYDNLLRDYLPKVGKPRVVITEKVSLKAEDIPVVRDQSQLGSCTGHGVRGILTYKVRQMGPQFRKPGYDLSPLFAYYNGRELEGSIHEDTGCYIRDVVKQAFKLGVATEATCPYNISAFARKPSEQAYTTGRWHQLKGGYKACLTADDILQSIAADIPVVFGYSVFSSHDSGREGHIPMPSAMDRLEGAHCCWFIDGDPKTRYFKFQNSWSEEYGDKGYYYLPFDYVDHGYADDIWAGVHE